MPFVALALLAVPLIEIALFIWIGGIIGVAWTLIAIVATAAIGIVVIRSQGRGLVADARAQVAANEKPVRPIFEGLCLVIAAVMLMTPGFFTDTLGFLLLVPPVRAALGYRWWEWSQRTGRMHFATGGGRGARSGDGPGRGQGRGQTRYGPGGPVVDGEAEEVDPSDGGANDPALPPVDRSRWGRRDDDTKGGRTG